MLVRDGKLRKVQEAINEGYIPIPHTEFDSHSTYNPSQEKYFVLRKEGDNSYQWVRCDLEDALYAKNPVLLVAPRGHRKYIFVSQKIYDILKGQEFFIPVDQPLSYKELQRIVLKLRRWDLLPAYDQKYHVTFGTQTKKFYIIDQDDRDFKFFSVRLSDVLIYPPNQLIKLINDPHFIR